MSGTYYKVTESTDLSAEPRDDIGVGVVFLAPAAVTFSATQLANRFLWRSATFEIYSPGSQWVIFNMNEATQFSPDFRFENWTAGEDRVFIKGDGDGETITGTIVNDTIYGQGGYDQVNGSLGADKQFGGSGYDSFVYTSADQLAGDSIDGGADDDMVWIQGNGDYVFGTLSDVQRLLISPFTAGQQTEVSVRCRGESFGPGGIFEVVMCSGVTQTLTITGDAIDVTGVTFSDWTPADHTLRLVAAEAASVITGSALSETIIGGRSGDVLSGGGGNDKFVASRGDSCSGGAGNDTFTLEGSYPRSTIIDGGEGRDRILIRNDTDCSLDSMKSIETVTFESAAVAVFAAGLLPAVGSNQQPVRSGITEFAASSGNDTLAIVGPLGDIVDFSRIKFTGWSSSDLVTMTGRDQYDYLVSSPVRDVLTGKGSADTFIFDKGSSKAGAWHDTITDFKAREDRLNLSAVDADLTKAGDQGFRIVTSFTGDAGELRIVRGTVNTMLTADLDGDGKADMQIELAGLVTLTPGTDLYL